jgi:cytochrome c
MQRVTSVFLFMLLACTGKAVYAESAGTEKLQTLLVRNNCTACHMIEKRKYGPTMKEVALKHGNDEAAIKKLAAKIKAGGTGVFGDDIMPPQPHVSDADARTIAELVLSLK